MSNADIGHLVTFRHGARHYFGTFAGAFTADNGKAIYTVDLAAEYGGTRENIVATGAPGRSMRRP